MWSLPDINRMNSEASSQKRKLERTAKSAPPKPEFLIAKS